MELNADIIRQLYSEIPSAIKAPGKTYRRHIRYYSSDQLPCLKTFYRFFSAVDKALPNYNLFLDNILVSGNKVLARYTISGTPKGKFMGLTAADVQMTIKGIDVFRFDRGKITDYWDSAHQITFSPGESQRYAGKGQLEGIGITLQEKQPSLSV
jgi:predicted ester cyclase